MNVTHSNFSSKNYKLKNLDKYWLWPKRKRMSTQVSFWLWNLILHLCEINRHFHNGKVDSLTFAMLIVSISFIILQFAWKKRTYKKVFNKKYIYVWSTQLLIDSESPVQTRRNLLRKCNGPVYNEKLETFIFLRFNHPIQTTAILLNSLNMP